MMELQGPAFSVNELIPAIVQEETTGKVLMLAYMNEEAYLKTIETKETWFFSRKRKELWNKGATSGNKQIVKHISYDCDGDSILVQVNAKGPACHTGEQTCFYNSVYENHHSYVDIIEELVANIRDRRVNPVDGSYTTYLFREGIDKVLKKVGEETSEVIIGAKNQDKEELTWEIADLTYHTLVLMEMTGVRISDIKKELLKRHNPIKGKGVVK
ncbi:bifunctional phosphoribosyl-AMP cyclohydrolase/phosphoribosyl-ATP diphosphatase HisIE [Ornithinibacillus sp. L9]|uniref:Histidine biosynthesis bifunctional protein HisIE n=1 Tax=Ornithinibacillus caprae TaxID=2678566 RepID=A0A6N8FPL3_9BACI|nr:bifunctional phosphoribosyl-AMP cyclohydrolase/phosphoribosyl-ATP diphosphatase HisIE [Ornithinibacillus caprae]MUK89799.1 bifunctional phosphoribosyl-AMP cyclohydrolase/phosphoribosyl-ATP diphosphatase HisIE [Ornithinibacillus caprae]